MLKRVFLEVRTKFLTNNSLSFGFKDFMNLCEMVSPHE
jgi:hypothetical protein